MALTAKQQRFVDAYLAHPNATQAAVKAGYSRKTANRIGSRLLSNVVIAGAIATAQQRATAAAEVTAAEVVAGLARIARFDRRRLYRPDGTLKAPHEWDDDTARVVTATETDEVIPVAAGTGKRKRLTVVATRKVRTSDPVRAWELLGRYFGLWKDGGGAATVNNTQVNLVNLSDADLDAIERILARAGEQPAPAVLPGPVPGGEGPPPAG